MLLLLMTVQYMPLHDRIQSVNFVRLNAVAGIKLKGPLG